MGKKERRRSARQSRQGYMGADVLPSEVKPPPADWLANIASKAKASGKSAGKDAAPSSADSQKE